MTNNEKISPAIIIVPIVAALGIGAAAMAAAGPPPEPPPEGYGCLYCEVTLPTLEELQEHVRTVHPGERIPIEGEWE